MSKALVLLLFALLPLAENLRLKKSKQNYAVIPDLPDGPDHVLPSDWKIRDFGKLQRNSRQLQNRISNEKVDDREYCLTPECVKSAGSLLNSMDLNVDPCDDFYDFVCGSWIDTAILEEASRHSVMGDMSKQNSFQVHKALMIPYDPKNVSKDEQMAKDFYTSCMNEDLSEKMTYNPIFDIFENKLKLPVPMFQLIRQDFDAETVSAVLESVLENFLLDSNIFGLDASRDPHNAKDKSMIMLYQPHVRLTGIKNNPLDDTEKFILSKYQEFNLQVVQELANFLTSNVFRGLKSEDLVIDTINLLGLEKRIALALNLTVVPEGSETILTWSELKQAMNAFEEPKHVDILKVTQRLMKRINDIDFKDETKLMVPDLSYFKQLNAILNVTPPRDIINYLLFGEVMKLLPLTTRKMQLLFAQFNVDIGKDPGLEAREGTCLDLATEYFGAKVAQLYSKRFHGEATKKLTESLIEDLRSSFGEMIQEASWMDEVTRQKAVKKLEMVSASDGFGQTLEDRIISEVYDGLIGIGHEELLWNKVTLMKFWGKKEIERLLGPPSNQGDINRLGFDTALVNAMYLPTENAVWVPLGIQEPPFFRAGTLDSLNYGAMGMVLGHELTHGFDNLGSKFDQDGNLEDWWTKETKDLFKEKYQCFIDEYEEFVYSELKEIPGFKGPFGVNGTQTLGENIADNGGIREAFRAYHKLLDKQSTNYQEPALPGLGQYTGDQMFFIGYASGWCETKTVGSLVNQLLSDPHPPAQLRIQGVLQNNEDFHQAFGCKVGDRMVSEKMCRVW